MNAIYSILRNLVSQNLWHEAKALVWILQQKSELTPLMKSWFREAQPEDLCWDSVALQYYPVYAIEGFYGLFEPAAWRGVLGYYIEIYAEEKEHLAQERTINRETINVFLSALYNILQENEGKLPEGTYIRVYSRWGFVPNSHWGNPLISCIQLKEGKLIVIR